MSPRPAAGKMGERGCGTPPQTSPDTPLDYALRVMRDNEVPLNLRVSVAKAALPYLHARRPPSEPPPPPDERPELSRTEIARRIAFLLDSSDDDDADGSANAPAAQAPPPSPPDQKSGTAPPLGASTPCDGASGAVRTRQAPPPVNCIIDSVRPDQVLPSARARAAQDLPQSYRTAAERRE